MKKLTTLLTLLLTLCLLAGCAGSPVVYYTDCTCPAEGHVQQVPSTCPADSPVVTAGSVKTGLALVTNVRDSVSAAEEAEGEAAYDVTVAAVNVDDNGVITACVIDSIGASVKFDDQGQITTDLTAEVLTKNEQGDAYNMKLYGNAKYEWYEQAAALADYAVGKTVEQLRSGAVNEAGKAADADLASVASIYLGGYVDAIELAVHNALHLGAQSGDVLKIAAISSLSDSKSAAEDAAGNAQLNVDVAAITMNGETITSCAIDSVQAKVAFDNAGAITSDISGNVLTKNELKEAYNMKLYGQAKFEWYEQAASFAAYVTGKTPGEVAGIAVEESTKPAADTDLAASVSIAIGGFQALIAKAAR